VLDADRRRAQRVVLNTPIPGRLESQSVSILEIGLAGSRLEHHQSLSIDSVVTLSFSWDDEELALSARVARCVLQPLLSERVGEMVYQSGLEFPEDSGRSSNMLRSMITSYVTRSLEELKQNARGGADTRATPFLKLDSGERKRTGTGEPESGRIYLRCRLSGQSWERTESLNPRQPPDGFTVLATHPAVELELLCKTYLASTEETRKMLRVCAELSLRD